MDITACLILKSSYTMVIAGKTGFGKTLFVSLLLKHQRAINEPPFEQIIYVYSIHQPIYDQMLVEVKDLELHEGLPQYLQLTGENTLFILDDMMLEMRNDKKLAEFFTKM